MCVSFSLLIYISFDPSLTEIVPTFPHSTLYTVTFHHCDISPLYTQCTLHTIHCDFSSLCTLHCTLFPTVQCTLYTLHFPQCALYTVHHPKEKEIEFATFRRQPLRAKYLFTKTNWMHSTFYFFLLVFWFIELLITLSIGQLKMHDQINLLRSPTKFTTKMPLFQVFYRHRPSCASCHSKYSSLDCNCNGIC